MPRISLVFGLVLGVAAVPACLGSDELPIPAPATDETPEAAQSLDEYIVGLGHLAVEPAQPKTEVECGDACPTNAQEGDAYCSYTRYSETEQFERFVAFQPNSATLWPGSIVRGFDAQQGLLTPIGLPRAPLTFSVSLENIDGSPTGTMTEPSLSQFREERNRILSAGLTGETPAALDFTVTEVYSESQVSLAIGASVSWPGGADIGGSFEWDSSEKKTKVVVNFTQAYYTIDIDTPTHPSDFFADGVTIADLEPHTVGHGPPLYVQSITFGRRVIFTVETKETAKNIRAALEATYNAGLASIGASVDVAYQKILEESTIRAFVLGGSSSDATGAISGFEGLMSYIQKGGNYTKDSPGAPIAYKLAYLDNTVTQMAFTTEYTERNCVKNRVKMRVELTGIDHVGGGDGGGNIELYGFLQIRHPVGSNHMTNCDEGGELADVWNLPAGSWISFKEFTTWTPSTAPFIVLEDVPAGPDERICLSAHVWEADTGFELSGDDDFGTDQLAVSFEDGWGGEHVLTPRGDGENGVDMRVTIVAE